MNTSKDKMLVEIKKGQTGTGLLIEKDGYISMDIEDNKVLRESIDSSSIDGYAYNLPRPFIVSAVFQKYDVVNGNGRIYPEKVLRREVEKYQQKIKDREAYGELQHPSEADINLERLSMNIVELHWVGKTLVGKMEIPVTEGFRRYGVCSTLFDNVAHLILSGLRIGVSSRSLGTVSQQGGQLIVNDDLEIICWDVVSQNSTPGAKIALDSRDLEQFIEHKEVKGNVLREGEENKYQKYLDWLSD